MGVVKTEKCCGGCGGPGMGEVTGVGVETSGICDGVGEQGGEGLLWLADQACEQCGAELPDVPGGAVDAAGL